VLDLVGTERVECTFTFVQILLLIWITLASSSKLTLVHFTIL
jgi:hypothetical protein